MKVYRSCIKRRRIVIVISILAFVAIFSCFIIARHDLFSKQIFYFNSEDVDLIRIDNGTTGQLIEYQDRVDIQELTNYLNSFHYKNRVADTPGIRDGWSYGIAIYINGESVHYQFDDDRILIDGVWYIGDDDYFSKLTTLFDSLPPQ